jgi:hypothetical protein
MVTAERLAIGQTMTLHEGQRIDSANSGDPQTFSAWDKWVADRIAQRDTATAEIMKESGLTEPIPGMAEMAGQGTFFDCAPYGTCWEPSAPAEQHARGGGPADDSQASSSAASQSPAAAARARSSVSRNTGPGATLYNTYEEDYFPCVPLDLRYQLYRNYLTWQTASIDPTFNPYPDAYDWAVCHAGSWIHRNHRYVWVANHRRHHLEPVRWVKCGRTVAFVPIHPYDVKGRPPLNRKEEVFTLDRKNGLSIERGKLDGNHPIELLKAPPRELRAAFVPPLSRAAEPHLATHQIKDGFGSKGNLARTGGIPLSFDHKSQTFMMARQGMQGSRTANTFAPVTNRNGNLQGGSGGYRGSFGGSSGSRGSFGGSSGAHSGGGGNFGGSSGSHSGGSSSSSSSSSASSGSTSGGSSSGSSAGSSGGHH